MECTTCQKRKERQKLASKQYYIRNSEKIINKTLTRRYLKKKDERREQSGDGDEGSSGTDEGDSTGSEGGGTSGDESSGGEGERETEKEKQKKKTNDP